MAMSWKLVLLHCSTSCKICLVKSLSDTVNYLLLLAISVIFALNLCPIGIEYIYWLLYDRY